MIEAFDTVAMLVALASALPIAFWAGYEVGRRRTNNRWTAWQRGGVSLPINHFRGSK